MTCLLLLGRRALGNVYGDQRCEGNESQINLDNNVVKGHFVECTISKFSHHLSWP